MQMFPNLEAIQWIEDVPFAGIMFEAGTHPVMFDFLMPGIDLVIWKMRPSNREPLSMELRLVVLQALEETINEEQPGAAICECEGYSIMSFRSVIRDQMLAEMGITEILPP